MEVLRFTTESYAQSERVRAWRTVLARLQLCARPADGSGLHGTLTSQASMGGFEWTLLAATAQTLDVRAGSDDDGAGSAVIVLHLDGDATMASAAGRERLLVRDIVCVAPGAQASLVFASDFRVFLVRVPRAVFQGRALGARSSGASHLSGSTGIALVFSRFLVAVAQSIETLPASELRLLETTLTELSAASMASHAHETVCGALTPSQAALFSRVCRAIELRLGDPALAMGALAGEERISLRYLQKLFETAGQSFSTYLRTRRLDRCRAELVDPLCDKVSVSEICFRWGFNDAAHFSRVFRERYGSSPRAYRQAATAELARQRVQSTSRGLPGDAVALALARDDAQAAATPRTRHVPSRACRDRAVDPTPRAEAVAAGAARVSCDADAAGHSGAAPEKHRHHLLRAHAATVHWGYFSHDLAPVLEIDSGDTVTIETLTQHAADDWERMVAGDAGAESVYHWTPDRKNVDRRGAGPLDASIYGRGAGEGFGVHICTGPIGVRGAEPGDVLEVRILDIRSRPCVNPKFHGRVFGSNAAAWWGFHYRELLTEPKPREVVTIYEIENGPGETPAPYARAVYNYRWTPQRDPFGIMHPTIDYPGIPVDHATIEKQYGVLKDIRIPVRPHFGVFAVAPRQDGLIDSIPPSAFGGNLDNWRIARGASVYLPVGVAGALLSIGDPHASQGDSELCGTAIECSLTGDFEIVLHKRGTWAGRPFADLSYPLVETADEWILHGFSHPNYLTEFGSDAQSEVYRKSTLDQAMRDAFIKTRRFLMTTRNLSEDEAISLMSVAVDFGITQIVDGNWGVHAIIRKALFTR
ncbi:MAG: acetamidase/formamidase family protein [Janthinobacterium lividum]